MKISSKGRYAVRLLVDLAKHQDNAYVSLKDISERQEISIKYLEQITRLLVKNKIITSGRGASGGYKLNKPANKINVAEVLEMTNDLSVSSCLSETGTACPRCNKCETFDCWEKLNLLISGYLKNVTIDKLVKD